MDRQQQHLPVSGAGEDDNASFPDGAELARVRRRADERLARAHAIFDDVLSADSEEFNRRHWQRGAQ